MEVREVHNARAAVVVSGCGGIDIGGNGHGSHVCARHARARHVRAHHICARCAGARHARACRAGAGRGSVHHIGGRHVRAVRVGGRHVGGWRGRARRIFGGRISLRGVSGVLLFQTLHERVGGLHGRNAGDGTLRMPELLQFHFGLKIDAHQGHKHRSFAGPCGKGHKARELGGHHRYSVPEGNALNGVPGFGQGNIAIVYRGVAERDAAIGNLEGFPLGGNGDVGPEGAEFFFKAFGHGGRHVVEGGNGRHAEQKDGQQRGGTPPFLPQAA